VLDGASELVGKDGVAFELAVSGGEHLGVGLEQRVVALGDDGGFAEGPAQIGVAIIPALP